MTRKDYVKLADALLRARNSATNRDMLRAVEYAVAYVGDVLAADNERFSRSRFEDACAGANGRARARRAA
jgi:hypothetical protein